MTLTEIETAIGQRLATLGKPIAWPNKEFTPSGEYIEFRHAPNELKDDTIDGAGAYQIGLILMTAVRPANEFTSAANTTAQAIIALFPKALRVAAGSGSVVVSNPVNPGTGFQDGAYWRQPLTLPYITEE